MPRSTATERSRRRRHLLDLLQGGLAGTQDEIRRRMARDGFRVTQATVSRDLDDLGAVRQRRGDAWVYSLPERNGPPDGLGRRLLSEMVIDCLPSGTLVVVRTYPGMAPTVAAILDASRTTGVVGTVAGDDTVLVVAAEDVGGRKLAERIRKLADQRGAS